MKLQKGYRSFHYNLDRSRVELDFENEMYCSIKMKFPVVSKDIKNYLLKGMWRCVNK